jgi:hypothetical protein
MYSTYQWILTVIKEQEKILLYLPIEEDDEKKIRNVGLCEAIVKFTEYEHNIKYI